MPEERCIRCGGPTSHWQNDLYPHGMGVVCDCCVEVEREAKKSLEEAKDE